MKKFFILPLCLVFCSCGMLLYPHSFKNEWQAGRFKAGTDNHIDDLIDINGYYMAKDSNTYVYCERSFIFYKDGSFGEVYFGNQCSGLEGEEGIDFVKYINQENGVFHWISGYYILKGDTIEVDVYNIFQLARILGKLRFKIIDRDKLLLLEYEEMLDEPFKKVRNTVCQFVPVSSLPSPETLGGIKFKRWMWENKKDWKDYKRKRKEFLKKEKVGE